MKSQEPEWSTIRHNRLSVKVAGFDSDEDLFAYIMGNPALPTLLAGGSPPPAYIKPKAPMAWYLDQLGDA